MFNWRLAKVGGIKELAGYASGLNIVRKLKFGEHYSCIQCNTNWFLNENNVLMEIIPSSRMDLVEEWNGRELVPSKQIVAELKRIGATPPDVHGNMAEFVQVPCKCLTKDGRVIDFCVVTFQMKPPIDDHYENVIFIDEVADVSESEYALSPKVRKASSDAREARMGFAPTLVQSKRGKRFVLNWTTNFFEMSGIKGKDIVLARGTLSKSMPPVYNEDYSRITWAVADWHQRFTKLRLKRRSVTSDPSLSP